MNSDYPQPGDLILAQQSEWYALKGGQYLRVCEQPGWAIPGRDIYVAPRKNVRSFWGPSYGAPDGTKVEELRTSGGPFLTATLALLPTPMFVERRSDQFWHWKDWPRSGGGVEYQREISLWHLTVLPEPAYLDPDARGAGPIRLGCASCEREDFDGVSQFPAGWTDVTFFQTLAQSLQEIAVDDLERSPVEWYTHLGVCPECAAADANETRSALS